MSRGAGVVVPEGLVGVFEKLLMLLMNCGFLHTTISQVYIRGHPEMG